MIGDYKVIDADDTFWDRWIFGKNYMEPKYRDRAPRMFMDTDGKERLNVSGKIIGGPRGLGRLGGIGLPLSQRGPVFRRYSELSDDAKAL